MIFLSPLRGEVRAASWFAALGEPLTDGDRADAQAYAGATDVTLIRTWREAEDFLKSPATSLDWWDREEKVRKELLTRAASKYPERALWTALTDLTTEAGDLVHGKAAAAAARQRIVRTRTSSTVRPGFCSEGYNRTARSGGRGFGSRGSGVGSCWRCR